MPAAAPLARPPNSALRAVPGDAGAPLVGDSFRYLRDQLGWARSRYERYGPVSWCRAFGDTIVSVVGPEASETVLVNRDRAFSQEGWHHYIGRFFPRGLMLLDFDEHLHHRRIMQQAFSRARLKGYVRQMAPAISTGLNAWRPSARFVVYPALKQLMLDLGTTAFVGMPLEQTVDGRRSTHVDRINRAFIDTVRAGTAVVRAPVPGGRWSRGLRGRRLLDAHIRALLPARRDSDGEDLFTALCQAVSPDGNVFSDDDVVNHMIFLLMAAHDTTTITLSTMVYLLARHPQWQEQARAESIALATDHIAFDNLEALTTLDLVMRESLRLVTPVPTLPRRTTCDTDVLGHYIPRGTTVVLNVALTHRLEQWWADPKVFDPGRFTPPRADAIPRYAYVPFGGGVHRCLGMHFGRLEVLAVMHQLLRRFCWTVDPDYVMPLDTTALPVPADGLPVRLDHRGDGHP